MPLAGGGGGHVRRLQLRAWCHAGFVLMTHFWASTGAPEPSCTTAKRVNDMVVDDKASYADLVSAAACPGADVTVQWRGAVLVDEPIVVAEKASLKIVGAPGAVIDGHSTTRLLVVNAGSTVHLQDMTLQNGHALTDATEAPWGGAAFVKSQGLLSIISSRFWFNEGQEVGGAIYQEAGGKLNCTDCVFLENTGSYGGAIDNHGEASFSSCKFTSNSAANAGGAIYQNEDGTLTCIDCVFAKNEADQDGGAIYLEFDGTLNCTDCLFAENAAQDAGGAIYQKRGGISNFTDSVFVDNHGSYGGAMDNYGSATITSCNFTSNSVVGSGGALFQQEGGILYCTGSVFTNNTGPSLGGAMENYGEATITSCNFTSNSVQKHGGAIYQWNSGMLNCTGSEFTENYAGERQLGGAFVLDASATVTVEDCTFRANASPRGGAVAITLPILETTAIMISFRGCQFVGNIAENTAGGAFLQEGTGSALFAKVDSATIFTNNSANCCYAGGQNSGVGASCVDVSTGYDSGWECCSDSQYIGAAPAEGTFTCKGCDTTGLVCTGVGVTSTTLTLDNGFWRETLTQEVVRQCWNSAACSGGAAAASVDEYCAAGYKGPYCAVCSDNYGALVGYRCVECTNTAVAIAFVVMAVVAVTAVFLLWVLVRAVGGASENAGGAKPTDIRSRVARIVLELMRRLRVPIVVLQVLTQYVSITGASLPLSYTEFLNSMSLVSLDLRWVTSPGCAMKVDFYGRLLMATLTPLAVIALIFVPRLYLIARARSERTPRQPHALLQRLVEKDRNAALAFTFLIFAGVSVTVFQTFACDELMYISKSYLRADYSIECYTPEHTAYRIFAGVMVLIYPIGIPALYMSTLWRCFGAHRDHGRTSELAKASSFLWEPYRAHAFHWEVVECLRRLMLTGLLVFIMPGTPGQSAVACVFAFFTGFVYESVRPHGERSDMWLYKLGYSIIFVTYFLSLLMQVSYTDEQSEAIIGNLLIALNVLLLVLALGQAILVLTSVRAQDGPVQQTSMFGILHRSSRLTESEVDAVQVEVEDAPTS
ncbi:hypothetical protein JKP88DRAFT_240807 [Tribonema minus]|uniref:Uncharacterized protein n=1 Tax=Tribonema minus TaxID=303371 RepID=A0A835ZLE8_9STRA|nr:hypothetical protein JKP88DRAFT_240807 [Tribonema minus]